MTNIATRFKKGNKFGKGAPKKEWTMSGLIKDALDIEDKEGTPRKVTIARKLSALAIKGDMVAIKEVNNRVDGMAVQKNILAGDEENPITIDVSGVLNKVYGKSKPDSVGAVSKDS